MKIRKITQENYSKVSALLRQAFPESMDEEQLIENLRRNGRSIVEWGCIHSNMIVAYIGFTNAYMGNEICGLHLAPLAVKPEFQNRGIGSELIRFALRQNIIQNKTLFVLGDPNFYRRFGFVFCKKPICPFDDNNAHFLSIRNTTSVQFTVGYEPEFSLG